MKIEHRVLMHIRTLQVLSALRDAPRRFNDLERTVKAPNPVAMSKRLKQMQRDGLIQRNVVRLGPPAVISYSLTDDGRALLEAATPMLKWVDDNADAVVARRELAKVKAAVAADVA